ncbi:MAG: ATP-dependent DNA helicase [Promethearchaeota archaeon]
MSTGIEDLSIPDSVKEVILEEGITGLYPPQEEAINAGVLDGKNVVLAIPTASGKTLIAELCMVKSIIEKGGKAIYLVPLRALASEKYNDFKKYEKIGVKVAVTSGDYDSADPWLERQDLIISTNEKADSLLRHRSRWISNLTVIVADETHLINDSSRGPTLEAVIAKLKQINPHAQILALSATISNAGEIAEWLDAKLVTSDWRPVELREGVYLRGGIEFNKGESAGLNPKYGNDVVDLVMDIVSKGGQALVFTGTRKSTASTASRIARVLPEFLTKNQRKTLKRVSETILRQGEITRMSRRLSELVLRGTSFHHAGLRYTHRKLVEDCFRRNLLKVICATPTLAAGINVPARRVIIGSYRRYEGGIGYYPIPVLEYKQMAGRAGRPKYDKEGEAVLLAKTENEKEFVMRNYVFGNPEKIWSKLAAEGALRTHILALIATGFAKDEKGLLEFINHTFYAHQYDPEDILEVVERIRQFLVEEEMIHHKNGRLSATRFGHRVSELYIDPKTGVTIRNALLSARSKETTPLSFMHLICHTPNMPSLYLRKKDYQELDVFTDEHFGEFIVEMPDQWLEPHEYEFFLSEVKVAKLLLDWTNETSEDLLTRRFDVGSGDIFRFVETADWLLYSTYEIGKLFKIRELTPQIKRTRVRVKNGVKEELLDLVRLKGIGRVRARMLFNAGFEDVKALKRAKPQQLTGIPLIGKEIAKKIKEQVGGVLTQKEWKELKSGRPDESDQKVLSEFEE